MSGVGEEPKGEIHDSMDDLEKPIDRSDFLKKLLAGGVISVAALSGLGGLQKALGQNTASGGTTGNSGDLASLIIVVDELRKELAALQGNFNGLVNGNFPAIKLTVGDIVAYKEHVNIDSVVAHKLGIDGEFAAHKGSVDDFSFIKMQSSDFAYLKLKQSNTDEYFLKLDGVDGLTTAKINSQDISTIKMDAQDVSAIKIVTTDISFQKQAPNTASDSEN
jgi:hypothetical protein